MLARVVTVRLRDCAPLPHDLVQAVQAAKAEVAQWTGHGPWLQALGLERVRADTPPNLAATLTRVRVLEPAAHEVVQVDQVSEAPTTQSTGHMMLLQVSTSWRCEQDLPLYCIG